LPDPTFADAYTQWTKNLSQLVVFVVIVMAAGAINSEVRSGVAALLLVKPASRAAYVLSHALVLWLFVSVASALGGLVTWGVTVAIFGQAPLAPVLGASGAWAVLVLVLAGASLWASAAFDAMAGAAGVGIGVYVLLAIHIVPWLANYTPFGLTSLPTTIIAGTQAPDGTLWWPLATGLVLGCGLVAGTIATFRRKELM
jgi:ABC-2 type transport system permease protein